MKNLRLIITLTLALAFLFAQAGNVAAAPLAQDSTPITGTVDTIVVEANANGDPVVVVTLLDGQSYTFSVETAASLGLVVLDENQQPVLDPVTGLPVVNVTKEGQPIEFLPADVLPDETQDEPVHPISALLGAFFNVDASVIDGYHEDGFGFGVIAQALWMSKNLADDASLAEQILQAKKDGSGTFTLSDGTEITYTNWGQLRKALLHKKENLGSVVSGQADDDSSQPGNGQGNGNGNGNGNGQGNDHGNGKGSGNGQGNGKGKGHNKP